MKVIKELLKGVQVLESPLFKDDRGMFLKVFNKDLEYEVRQINYVETKEKFTLRGLHFQKGVHAESKVFRCMKGSVQLAFFCVDPDHSEYGKSSSYILSNEKQAVLIPRGFATGYLTLSSDAVVLYLSDNDYESKSEGGIKWNDSSLNIDWETENPITSGKDQLWEPWVR